MAYLYGQVNYKPIVSALWYDADGIMYSVPVNAMKPSLTSDLTINYTIPLDAKKEWSLSLLGVATYSYSISYQARTTLPALDKDTFDYSLFMADFWGNADGDRFYGGQSGFSESSTHSFSPYAGFTVKYNPEHWSFSAGANTQGRIARYSLNPKANLNTLDTRLSSGDLIPPSTNSSSILTLPMCSIRDIKPAMASRNGSGMQRSRRISVLSI